MEAQIHLLSDKKRGTPTSSMAATTLVVRENGHPRSWPCHRQEAKCFSQKIRLLSDKRERPHLGHGCKKPVVCENEERTNPQTVFADTPEAAPPWMRSKMFLSRPGLLT
ncbi:hypothetical protein QYF36_021338 [Acer negundo]|nr:hypothetical protein QYF36_021338 [Acer negundo]